MLVLALWGIGFHAGLGENFLFKSILEFGEYMYVAKFDSLKLIFIARFKLLKTVGIVELNFNTPMKT